MRIFLNCFISQRGKPHFKGGFCMANLLKILSSLVILIIFALIAIFSFYLILAAVAVAGLIGISRHYFGKKKTEIFAARPKGCTSGKGFTSGEIIDLPK
jgi:hypothetical protein